MSKNGLAIMEPASGSDDLLSQDEQRAMVRQALKDFGAQLFQCNMMLVANRGSQEAARELETKRVMLQQAIGNLRAEYADLLADVPADPMPTEPLPQE